MKAINKILFTAGGTGGHIYPAIAIAKEFKQRVDNIEILFVGANNKMEMDIVPKEGFNIEGINIGGIQRKLTLKNIINNLILPFKIISSIYSAYIIIKKFKPNMAIGTGGYVSGPTLMVCNWMNIPFFVQEQNALPGITNRILSKYATAVFTSFEKMNNYFACKNVIYTGNAIRSSAIDTNITKKEACLIYGLDSDRPSVFITGGSLGALAINEAIAINIDKLESENVQVLWQVGKHYIERFKHLNTKNIKVVDFIHDMNIAYAMADIIVSRAGGAIFEMFIIGKPLIVLPSPNVAEDHQTKNALRLQEKNSAIMIKDSQAKETLVLTILDLLKNNNLQSKMIENIAKLAKPNSTKEIVDNIQEILKK